MNYKKTEAGYIGIISLVIVCLLIMCIILRPDVFTGDKKTKGTLETGLDAVERARDISVQSGTHAQEVDSLPE